MFWRFSEILNLNEQLNECKKQYALLQQQNKDESVNLNHILEQKQKLLLIFFTIFCCLVLKISICSAYDQLNKDFAARNDNNGSYQQQIRSKNT